MLDQIRVGLARWLSPTMYEAAVVNSEERLRAEIVKMALSLIIDEMGTELERRGATHDEVMAVINRGADRASMAGDIIIMSAAEGNENITPSDLLG